MNVTLSPLPRRCFVSHSYRDKGSLDALRSIIQPEVEPYVFPPITVSPDQFVSSALIDAILSQEGLIYLLGGHSAESFWVSFERDYGLRSRRRVFSFDFDALRVRPDNTDPRNVFVYPSYARHDGDHVRQITDYMARRRHFEVWTDCAILESAESSLQKSIQAVLDRGGYAVLFWSQEAARSSFISKEMEWVWRYKRDRILLALLEEIPPPTWLGDDLPPWLSPVQLFGDSDRSEMNRWDDLIVRLYWLVYNNDGL